MALMLQCYIVLHLEESPSEIAVEGVSKNRVLHFTEFFCLGVCRNGCFFLQNVFYWHMRLLSSAHETAFMCSCFCMCIRPYNIMYARTP